MININSGELSDALARCKHSISSEETRHYLCGIHLRRTDDGVMFESTDGHRMTQARVKIRDVPQFKDIIISRKCAAEIQKNCKRGHGHRDSQIDVVGKTITLPEAQLALELVDGTFPDCDRVIPSKQGGKLTASREDFQKAISAIAAFSGANDETPAVKLSYTKEKLTFSAKNGDGAASVAIECASSDARDGFEIGFNGRFILEWVKTIDSNNVMLTITDSGSPTLFAGVGLDDHATTVIMPMRV